MTYLDKLKEIFPEKSDLELGYFIHNTCPKEELRMEDAPSIDGCDTKTNGPTCYDCWTSDILQ